MVALLLPPWGRGVKAGGGRGRDELRRVRPALKECRGQPDRPLRLKGAAQSKAHGGAGTSDSARRFLRHAAFVDHVSVWIRPLE